MKSEKSIGEKIKELREEKGIQAKDIADYLGVTQSAMSNYEKGKRSIDTDTLVKIAKYLNVTTDFLLLNTDPAEIKLNDREKRLLESFNNLSKEKQEAYLKLLEIDSK